MLPLFRYLKNKEYTMKEHTFWLKERVLICQRKSLFYFELR